MTGASFQTSTTLSFLGSLVPYWDSQLKMEYSKDLFTCEVLDAKIMDGRYKLVKGFIYFHEHIYLAKDSKLKARLLNAAYEILVSKPTGFIRAYHTILDGFMWEGFKEEVHSHMEKCMDYLLDKEEHSSWEEPSFTPPYSVSKRGDSSMNHLTNVKQVYGGTCLYEYYDVSPI